MQSTLNIDVNVLLYVGWISNAHHVKLPDDAIAALDGRIQTWRDTVVRPLRTIRQDLKTMPIMAHDAVKHLRSEIAHIELRAEQFEQAMLYDATDELIGGLIDCAAKTTAAEAIQHNFSVYLKRRIPSEDRNSPDTAKTYCLMAEAIAYRSASDESSQ